MKLKKIEYVLRDILKEARLSYDNPDLFRFLDTYEKFASIPTGCEKDFFLFNTTVDDSSGMQIFMIFLVRWLEKNLPEGGKRIVHLVCALDYGHRPELFNIKLRINSLGMNSVEEFFKQIKANQEVQVLKDGYMPKRLSVFRC